MYTHRPLNFALLMNFVQGIFMGIIMFFANMGRLWGPLWAGYAFPYVKADGTSVGSALLYSGCGAFICLTSILFLIGYMKFQKKKRPVTLPYEPTPQGVEDAKPLLDDQH